MNKAVLMAIVSAGGLLAEGVPADYAVVLKALGKHFKENVLKMNIPRDDLKVTIDGIATPTPFGFRGWLAMTEADGGIPSPSTDQQPNY